MVFEIHAVIYGEINEEGILYSFLIKSLLESALWVKLMHEKYGPLWLCVEIGLN